jgi:hypothetical protein
MRLVADRRPDRTDSHAELRAQDCCHTTNEVQVHVRGDSRLDAPDLRV